MREDVLDPLLETESGDADTLANPPPSRSSKSNHLIYDPTVSDKVLTNLVASQKSPKVNQNPLSPSSPAASKKNRKSAAGGSSMVAYYDSYSSGGPSTSEEEEAASELISGLERFSGGNQQQRSHQPQQPVYRPVEILRYPMRSDPGDDIAKILEDKRNRPHEQDVIHRNRLHTHILMGNSCVDDERERIMIAELLKSVKIKIEAAGDRNNEISNLDHSMPTKSQSKSRISTQVNDSNDPRSLNDIQESLVSLQTSLLATQNSYKHTMKALKKHHDVTVLPASLPVQSKKISVGTRRSSERP